MRDKIGLALALLIGLTSSALAVEQPLPPFHMGELITSETVACDTEEQLTAIIEKTQETGDFRAGVEVYMEFFFSRNDDGESICRQDRYTGVIVEMKPMGKMDGPGAPIGPEEFWVWAVHITNEAGTGWLMLTNTLSGAKPVKDSRDA